MNFNLDRQTKVSSKSEFPRLYSWFIQELNEDGSTASDPQVPWDGNSFFNIKNINYCLEMNNGANERQVNWDEYFYAKMLPSEDGSVVTNYSMFGTDRVIKDIRLYIKAAAEGAAEACRVLGGVSYAYESDFEMKETPDYLYVIVSLSPEQFKNIKETLSGNRKIIGSLLLSGVAGFYSEWSPSIRASEVKVLVDKRDQNLKFDSDNGIELPKIGQVEKFRLTISSSLDN